MKRPIRIVNLLAMADLPSPFARVAITLLESPKSTQELLNYAANGKRVYIGLRAGSTFQALEQWRKLVGDDATAMKDLRMG